MSNVIVKDNESLDSALRRFKRNCAKLAFSRRFARESITRNQALDVRRNPKLLENANTINQDKIPGCLSAGNFLYNRKRSFLLYKTLCGDRTGLERKMPLLRPARVCALAHTFLCAKNEGRPGEFLPSPLRL